MATARYEKTEFDGFIVPFRSKIFHEIQKLDIRIVTRVLPPPTGAERFDGVQSGLPQLFAGQW